MLFSSISRASHPSTAQFSTASAQKVTLSGKRSSRVSSLLARMVQQAVPRSIRQPASPPPTSATASLLRHTAHPTLLRLPMLTAMTSTSLSRTDASPSPMTSLLTLSFSPQVSTITWAITSMPRSTVHRPTSHRTRCCSTSPSRMLTAPSFMATATRAWPTSPGRRSAPAPILTGHGTATRQNPIPAMC